MKKILYTAASSGTINDQGKMAITLIKKMESKSFDKIYIGLQLTMEAAKNYIYEQGTMITTLTKTS